MRVLFTIEGKRYRAFWCKRRRDSILGSWGRSFASPNSPELGAIQESHFFYPRDGRVHYSFKWLGADGRPLRIEHVFQRTVRTKEFPKGSKPYFLLRRRSEDAPHEFMVPTQRQLPLASYGGSPAVFQFPTAGYGFPALHPSAGHLVEATGMPRADDIVVDLTQFDPPGTFNIHCELWGASVPAGRCPIPNEIGRVVDDSQQPWLVLFVTYFDGD